MPIAKAEVALVGKDLTGQAFKNVIRNAETAQRQISQKLSSAFKLLGVGTAIFAIGRSVASSIKMGDDLAKFAEKSGLAAEAASELAHAAKMADLDLGSLSTGVKRMQQTLSEAGSGGKPALNLLKSLGIEIDTIKRLQPDQQFELFAEQISKLKNPADRTRAAVEAFGRSGADLLPLFSDGAEGIRRAREEAQQLGRSFSAADLAMFAEADAAWKAMKASAGGLGDTLALKTSPALTEFFNILRRGLGGGTEREKLIANIEGQIAGLARAGEHAGPRLEQLRKKLELLLNPLSDPLAGRGRVFNAGEVPPGFEWLATVEKQAKLTKAELAELERFASQDIWGRQQEARLDAPLTAAGDTAAILRGRMAEITAENVRATSRVIELGAAFVVADESAKGLMATIKDESARRAFGAISDVFYGLNLNARDFATNLIDASRRILADEATKKLFALFKGDQGEDGWLARIFGAVEKRAQGGGASAAERATEIVKRIKDDAAACKCIHEAMMGSSSSILGGLANQTVDLLKGVDDGFDRTSNAITINANANAKFLSQTMWAVQKSQVTNDLLGSIANAFAGGFAEGGSLPAGRWGIAGEDGREAVLGPATIIPFKKLGRESSQVTNVTVSPIYNIDNRGATVDAMKALPGILKENNRQLTEAIESRIVTGIRRRRYDLG